MTSTAKVLPLLALVLSLAVQAQATSIPFDVTSVGDFDGTFYHSADGTSNGVGWTVSGVSPDSFLSWGAQTTTDGTFQGFTDGTFSIPLANTDRLHTFGTDMTITFSQNISSILFYLKENGGSSTLDFGLIPEFVSGFVDINGTKVTGTQAGGLIRFSNLNTNTLTSLTTILDGMDTAWVVESTVPDAGGSALLLGLGLAGLGWARRTFSA
jgi:hypothetical protein